MSGDVGANGAIDWMERLRKVLAEGCRPSVERVLARSFWSAGPAPRRPVVSDFRTDEAEEYGSAEGFQEL
jgi:hypothetical protein